MDINIEGLNSFIKCSLIAVTIISTIIDIITIIAMWKLFENFYI